MGTRSTYRVIEQWTDDKTGKIKNENLVLVYLQYDGYPTGHPIDTAEWLSTGTIVNGYSPGEEKLVFNGAGCLAAQLVDKMKTGTGGCYIHSLSSRGKSWEDYLYDIIVKEDKSIEYVCYENGSKKKELFRGSPADFVIKYHKEDVEA
jgi:hypothetical protein